MIGFEGLLGGSAYSNTFHQVMLKVCNNIKNKCLIVKTQKINK